MNLRCRFGLHDLPRNPEKGLIAKCNRCDHRFRRCAANKAGWWQIWVRA